MFLLILSGQKSEMAADQVKDRLEEPQESAQLDISNSYQKYHWDCGIACAQMVLR